MRNNFIKRLEKELGKSLPGEPAQRKMAPRVHRVFRTSGSAGKAGVLLLLFPRKGDLHILFIKRTEYPGPHSGQISFPGGKMEDGDKTVIYTALREAAEETGTDPDMVTVMGTLTPLFIPVSNLEVLPVVGYASRQPQFIIDPQEVEYLIPASLGELADNKLKTEEKLNVSGITIRAPGYRVGGEFIWGATAMILSEFMELAGFAGLNGQ
ncbi:MAG: CoA pyrophosphatase [Marinilabiliales bacterium]|nr:MAG: CoA pyrophosphatase [Marinilabiliales bacterium]